MNQKKKLQMMHGMRGFWVGIILTSFIWWILMSEHRLDLVPFYINRSRNLISKWYGMSREDLILLSHYSLDKEYIVTYRSKKDDVLSKLDGDTLIQPSKSLEVFVEIIRK